MATFSFFAGPSDARAVFSYALTDLSCVGFEAYSRVGHTARRLTDPAEIDEVFDQGLITDTGVMVALWAPATGGNPVIERINLDDGSYREMVVGWGVIRLNFGVIDRNDRRLSASGVGHNSLNRALRWEETSGDQLGPIDAWNWDELERVSRRFRYHVSRRIGVGKIESSPVLAEADELQTQGYRLTE